MAAVIFYGIVFACVVFAIAIVIRDIIEVRKSNRTFRIFEERRKQLFAALPNYPYCISLDTIKNYNNISSIGVWMLDANLHLVGDSLLMRDPDLENGDVIVLTAVDITEQAPVIEYHFKDSARATEFKLLFG